MYGCTISGRGGASACACDWNGSGGGDGTVTVSDGGGGGGDVNDAGCRKCGNVVVVVVVGGGGGKVVCINWDAAGVKDVGDILFEGERNDLLADPTLTVPLPLLPSVTPLLVLLLPPRMPSMSLTLLTLLTLMALLKLLIRLGTCTVTSREDIRVDTLTTCPRAHFRRKSPLANLSSSQALRT